MAYKFIFIKKVIIFFIAFLSTYAVYKIIFSQSEYQGLDDNLLDRDDYGVSEEINFPIAFGISVYRDPVQFQYLLQAIYRPFNVYCIHVDLKSDRNIHKFVLNLSKKYTNIIVPKEFVNVVHGQFSVLKSELLCMEALYQYKDIKWKYFINLTGQEWPLKVNLELVRILKALRGTNLVEKIEINSDRIPSDIGHPPHGITLWKGAVHIIVVRDFVRFALMDKRALDLLNYLRKTAIPDETYFSTLNNDHVLRAPGGYSGDLMRDPIHYPYLNRYKLWFGESPCHGKYVRYICIFSMDDVPDMIDVKNKKLFANKFIMDINPDVFNLMRMWLHNRTEIVYANTKINPFINVTFYSQLAMVKNHY